MWTHKKKGSRGLPSVPVVSDSLVSYQMWTTHATETNHQEVEVTVHVVIRSEAKETCVNHGEWRGRANDPGLLCNSHGDLIDWTPLKRELRSSSWGALVTNKRNTCGKLCGKLSTKRKTQKNIHSFHSCINKRSNNCCCSCYHSS